MTYDEVISLENLCEAWQEFIRGKRGKKDVQEFALRLGDEIVKLHEDLVSGAYHHGPYHEFRINDPKPRIIHKASVRDRLLHHAIHRKLYPEFANTFIADSFSCQKGKGVHRALNRFQEQARKVGKNNFKTCWVLKCDIRKFFASVDHFVLAELLEKQIQDLKLLQLLHEVINSFSVSLGKGIPLGNLTSQLFANIYLDSLDQFVKRSLRVKRYVRYADDFVFLSSNRSELDGILEDVRFFLSSKLALDLHPDKVFLKTINSGIDFLGWIHFPEHRVLRTKTKQRMMKRITGKSLQSYLGMLSHGDGFTLEKQILNINWLSG
ncbi:MAG: reverse transcriptase/maturase family protein [Candidatus Uhrbacteria bacterium]